MKILVIPDVHLKPWMFRQAAELMENRVADKAVCLMDIADDFGKQYNMQCYRDTYDEAIRFAKRFPNTLWCYGNHDVSYLWQKKESGYSPLAPKLVCTKLKELKEALPDERQLAYIHRIDHVLFMHGGLSEAFVRKHQPAGAYEHTDSVIRKINEFGSEQIWDPVLSPIWFRPQWWVTREEMYLPDQYLQVVGHTPMKHIEQTFDCLISCDVFSTETDGTQYGSEEFLLLDTETWDWRGVKGNSEYKTD